MYRMYHNLYNDFAKLPVSKDKGLQPSNPLGYQNKNNKPYMNINYKEKIKSFLFKEI